MPLDHSQDAAKIGRQVSEQIGVPFLIGHGPTLIRVVRPICASGKVARRCHGIEHIHAAIPLAS